MELRKEQELRKELANELNEYKQLIAKSDNNKLIAMATKVIKIFSNYYYRFIFHLAVQRNCAWLVKRKMREFAFRGSACEQS